MTETESTIRRYTSVAAIIDMLVTKQLALLNPESWDDRNDSYFLNLYKQQRPCTALYALCASRAPETYHHWRVFTIAAEGACIELLRNPLEQALHDLSHVRFQEVEYLSL